MKPAWIVLTLALAACAEETTTITVPLPTPGGTLPGAPCKEPTDCGCWECTCEGIDGPGGAQLCQDDRCPTGDEACAAVCDLAHAKVATASAITSFHIHP